MADNGQALQQYLDKTQLPKNVKADVWDAYQGAADQNSFKTSFDKLQIPKNVKGDLWEMKFSGVPTPPPPGQVIGTGPGMRPPQENAPIGYDIAHPLAAKALDIGQKVVAPTEYLPTKFEEFYQGAHQRMQEQAATHLAGHPVLAAATTGIGGATLDYSKLLGQMLSDPKNWPFIAAGQGEVRPLIHEVSTALFTALNQQGALEAATRGDWQNAGVQQAFALVGLSGLAPEVKAKVTQHVVEQHAPAAGVPAAGLREAPPERMGTLPTLPTYPGQFTPEVAKGARAALRGMVKADKAAAKVAAQSPAKAGVPVQATTFQTADYLRSKGVEDVVSEKYPSGDSATYGTYKGGIAGALESKKGYSVAEQAVRDAQAGVFESIVGRLPDKAEADMMYLPPKGFQGNSLEAAKQVAEGIRKAKTPTIQVAPPAPKPETPTAPITTAAPTPPPKPPRAEIPVPPEQVRANDLLNQAREAQRRLQTAQDVLDKHERAKVYAAQKDLLKPADVAAQKAELRNIKAKKEGGGLGPEEFDRLDDRQKAIQESLQKHEAAKKQPGKFGLLEGMGLKYAQQEVASAAKDVQLKRQAWARALPTAQVPDTVKAVESESAKYRSSAADLDMLIESSKAAREQRQALKAGQLTQAERQGLHAELGDRMEERYQLVKPGIVAKNQRLQKQVAEARADAEAKLKDPNLSAEKKAQIENLLQPIKRTLYTYDPETGQPRLDAAGNPIIDYARGKGGYEEFPKTFIKVRGYVGKAVPERTAAGGIKLTATVPEITKRLTKELLGRSINRVLSLDELTKLRDVAKSRAQEVDDFALWMRRERGYPRTIAAPQKPIEVSATEATEAGVPPEKIPAIQVAEARPSAQAIADRINQRAQEIHAPVRAVGLSHDIQNLVAPGQDVTTTGAWLAKDAWEKLQANKGQRGSLGTLSDVIIGPDAMDVTENLGIDPHIVFADLHDPKTEAKLGALPDGKPVIILNSAAALDANKIVELVGREAARIHQLIGKGQEAKIITPSGAPRLGAAPEVPKVDRDALTHAALRAFEKQKGTIATPEETGAISRKIAKLPEEAAFRQQESLHQRGFTRPAPLPETAPTPLPEKARTGLTKVQDFRKRLEKGEQIAPSEREGLQKLGLDTERLTRGEIIQKLKGIETRLTKRPKAVQAEQVKAAMKAREIEEAKVTRLADEDIPPPDYSYRLEQERQSVPVPKAERVQMTADEIAELKAPPAPPEETPHPAEVLKTPIPKVVVPPTGMFNPKEIADSINPHGFITRDEANMALRKRNLPATKENINKIMAAAAGVKAPKAETAKIESLPKAAQETWGRVKTYVQTLTKTGHGDAAKAILDVVKARPDLNAEAKVYIAERALKGYGSAVINNIKEPLNRALDYALKGTVGPGGGLGMRFLPVKVVGPEHFSTKFLVQRAISAGLKTIRMADEHTTPWKLWISPDGKYGIRVEDTHWNTVADLFGIRQRFDTGNLINKLHDQMFENGWIRKASPDAYDLAEKPSPEQLRIVEQDIQKAGPKTHDVFLDFSGGKLGKGTSYVVDAATVRERGLDIALRDSRALAAGTGHILGGLRQAMPGMVDPSAVRTLASKIVGHFNEAFSNDITLADVGIGRLRQDMAHRARVQDQVEAYVKEASARWDKKSKSESLNFFNKFETGHFEEMSPEDQVLAHTLHDLADDRFNRIANLGAGFELNYLENYMKHAWERPHAITETWRNIINKKPFEGSKGFLRQRYHALIVDGIAAGLKPITYNPVKMQLHGIAEMDRFLMAHENFLDGKATGAYQYIRHGQQVPTNWEKLDDKVFVVKYYSPVEKGMIERGGYYAPKEMARFFNNVFASQSIYGMKGFVGTMARGYIGLNNQLLAIKLGFSFFHGMFEANNAMISVIDRGLQDVVWGEYGAATKKFGFAALGPIPSAIKYFRKGEAIRKAWVDPWHAPSEDVRTAQMLEMAGARYGQRGYGERQTMAFGRSMTDLTEAITQRKYADMFAPAFQTALRAIPALTRFVARPLMEEFVPRIKFGAAAYALEDAHRRMGLNPDIPKMRYEFHKINDEVENRHGLVTYPNWGIGRKVKEFLQATFQSLGWTGGSGKTFGQALFIAKEHGHWRPGDIPMAVLKGLTGKLERTDITPRITYIAAVALGTAYLGGVIHTMLTGHLPTEAKDFFHPKTGKKDAQGRDERLSLATYWKDLEAGAGAVRDITKGQLTTTRQFVSHKLTPAIHFLDEVTSNKDFWNVQIVDPKAPVTEQLKQAARYFFTQQTVPYNIHNMQARKELGASFREQVMMGLGLAAPATARVNMSPTQREISDVLSRSGGYVRTPEEHAKAQWKAQLQNKMFAGEIGVPELVKLGVNPPEGRPQLTVTDMQHIVDSVTLGPTVAAYKKLPLKDAVRIFRDVATLDEQDQLIGQLAAKADHAKEVTPNQYNEIAPQLLSAVNAYFESKAKERIPLSVPSKGRL